MIFFSGYDDENGSYLKALHDHLVYRYEVLEVLGKGSFGQVVKALDHKTGQHVAVKIIRNKKRCETSTCAIYTLVNSALRYLSFFTDCAFNFCTTVHTWRFLFPRFHQQALVEVKILEHLRKKVSMIMKYPYLAFKNTLGSKRCIIGSL